MLDSTKPGNITTKTTIEQETACFVDDGTNMDCYGFIPTMLEFLPTHAVFSGVRDIWYVLLSSTHLLESREVVTYFCGLGQMVYMR
jgi:hypothetical protein